LYSFTNDYSESCHPAILKALSEASGQYTGYGEDEICISAANRIRKECGVADAAVHFVAGGTLTNMLAISSFLRPHQAAIAADTGHINVHETGAVEATGHKVLTIGTPDGKLTPELIQKVLDVHGNDEHMVQPKLVYISNSTEVGTIYKKAELKAIRDLCSANGLYLFLDGARLGSALTCAENDMTMADIAEMTDCFYIGGTKNGAMLGEALVITNPELKTDFRHLYKQRGAMMAKGWIMGIQFDTLFTDGLFYKLAKHENEVAAYIAKELNAMGVRFLADSPTNQIFPILNKAVAEKLEQNFRFAVWAPISEDEVAVRFVTSWATPMEQAQALVAAVRAAL